LADPFKILVVDDHPLVRRGLVYSLGEREEWGVCGEATNGREAISEFQRLKPDLVLMDISMPVMNGLEATAEIRRISPAAKIVILSMHDSSQIQAQAINAGANAYLVKTATTQEISRILRSVLMGDLRSCLNVVERGFSSVAIRSKQPPLNHRNLVGCDSTKFQFPSPCPDQNARHPHTPLPSHRCRTA
jgi:DNA-binding NarL/FixJ family response regulator